MTVAGTRNLLNRLARSTAQTTVWRPEEVGSLEPALVDRFAASIVNRFPDVAAKYRPEQPEVEEAEPAAPAREMSLAEIREMLAAQRGELPASFLPESRSDSPPASPPPAAGIRRKPEPQSHVERPARQMPPPDAIQAAGPPPRILGRRRRRATVEYVTPQGAGTIDAPESEAPATLEPPSSPPLPPTPEDEAESSPEPESSFELPSEAVPRDDLRPPTAEPRAALSAGPPESAPSISARPVESAPPARPDRPATEPLLPHRRPARQASAPSGEQRDADPQAPAGGRAEVEPLHPNDPPPPPSARPESGSTFEQPVFPSLPDPEARAIPATPEPSARPSESRSEIGPTPDHSRPPAAASEESGWDAGPPLPRPEAAPPHSGGPNVPGVHDKLNQELTFRSSAQGERPASRTGDGGEPVAGEPPAFAGPQPPTPSPEGPHSSGDHDRPRTSPPSPGAGHRPAVEEPAAPPSLQRQPDRGHTPSMDDREGTPPGPFPPGRSPSDPEPPDLELRRRSAGTTTPPESQSRPAPRPADSEARHESAAPPAAQAPHALDHQGVGPRRETPATGEPPASRASHTPELPVPGSRQESPASAALLPGHSPLSSEAERVQRTADAGNEPEGARPRLSEGSVATEDNRDTPPVPAGESTLDAGGDVPPADRVPSSPRAAGLDRDQAMPLRARRPEAEAEQGEPPVLGAPPASEAGRSQSGPAGVPAGEPGEDVPTRPSQAARPLPEPDPDSGAQSGQATDAPERAMAARPDPGSADEQGPPPPMRRSTDGERRGHSSGDPAGELIEPAPGASEAWPASAEERPSSGDHHGAEKRPAGAPRGRVDLELPLRRAPRDEQPPFPEAPPAATERVSSPGEGPRLAGHDVRAGRPGESALPAGRTPERELPFREATGWDEAASPAESDRPAPGDAPHVDLKPDLSGRQPAPGDLSRAGIEAQPPSESQAGGALRRLDQEMPLRPAQGRDEDEQERLPGSPRSLPESKSGGPRSPQDDAGGEPAAGELSEPRQSARRRPGVQPPEDEASAREPTSPAGSPDLPRGEAPRTGEPPALPGELRRSFAPGEDPGPAVRAPAMDTTAGDLPGSGRPPAENRPAAGPEAVPPSAGVEAPGRPAAGQASLQAQPGQAPRGNHAPPLPGERFPRRAPMVKGGLDQEMPYRRQAPGTPSEPETASHDEPSAPDRPSEAPGGPLRRSPAGEAPVAAPRGHRDEPAEPEASQPYRARPDSRLESHESGIFARAAARGRVSLTGSVPLSLERLVRRLLLEPLPPEIGRRLSLPAGGADDSGALARDRSPVSSGPARGRGPSAPTVTPRAVAAQMVSRGWRFKQRSPEGSAGPDEIRRVVDDLERPAGSGRPLDPGPRRLMEQVLGRDFGDVRLHRAPVGILQAAAATRGRDIYIEPGEARFESPESLALLGHELTHVAQSGLAPARPPVQRAPLPAPATGRVGDDEAEAERSERRILDLARPQPSSSPFPLLEMPLVAGAPPVAQEQQQSSGPRAPGARPAGPAGVQVGSTPIQRQVERAVSDHPAVIQRAPDSPDTSGEASAPADREPEQQPNLDELARQIYPLIKRMLAIERERRPSR